MTLVAKTKFKPESITFLNRQAGVRGSVENLTKAFKKEDLRDTGRSGCCSGEGKGIARANREDE